MNEYVWMSIIDQLKQNADTAIIEYHRDPAELQAGKWVAYHEVLTLLQQALRQADVDLAQYNLAVDVDAWFNG